MTEDDGIEIVHVMWSDGCRLSLNGQGHLPCSCERCNDTERCCMEHHIHVSPHRGCILR